MKEYKTSLDFSELHKHITVVNHGGMKTGRFIGIYGPARSGLSALFFLFTKLEAIQRLYYQPLTTLQRLGGPDFTIDLGSTTFMKEVFWSMNEKWRYDPIDIILKSGVPKELQQHVFVVRNPVETFSSWRIIEPNVTTESFIYWFTNTVDQYETKKSLGFSVIPFVYEMFKDNELFIINKLVSKLGIRERVADLTFPKTLNPERILLGQASEKEYFNKVLFNTYNKKHFEYKSRDVDIDIGEVKEIEHKCSDPYLRMLQNSHQELFFD